MKKIVLRVCSKNHFTSLYGSARWRRCSQADKSQGSDIIRGEHRLISAVTRSVHVILFVCLLYTLDSLTIYIFEPVMFFVSSFSL